MVVAGGFVAWFADNLGRTLGKKRLTLFHMRPRHTATLLTVLAGMLIPFITVVAVATVSEEARQWLAVGHRAIEDRDKAIRQRDQEVQRLRTAMDRNDELNKKNSNLAERQSKLIASNESLNRRNLGLARTIETNRLTLSGLRARIQTLTASVARTQTQLRTTQEQFKLASNRLVVASKQLDQVKLQRDMIQVSFNTIKKQVDEQYKENARLVAENLKLGQELTRLGDERKDLDLQINEARNLVAESKRQLESTKLQLDQANADLTITMENVKKYFLSDPSRFAPIIVGLGEELARVSVPANSTEEEAKGLFNNLMKRAVEVASLRGAKPGNGSSLPAGLWERPVDEKTRISPKVQEETIVRGITRSSEDLVLVATSFTNAFEGEWVPLDIKSYRNPLVYKKDQFVAETRMNGVRPEDELFQQVSEFLRGTVRPQAIRDKMIPVSGTMVGEVRTIEIWDLVRRIRDASRPVRVVAVADADTHAADPLKLRFRVQ